MTRSYDLAFISNQAGIHPSQEADLIKWYSNLGFEARVDLMDQAHQIFKTWPTRKQYQKDQLSELQYASLLKVLKQKKSAIENLHKKITHDKKQKPEGSILNQEILISLKPQKKEQKKRRLIRLRFYSAIKELREMSPPKSWRDIQEYIRRNHKVKISHVYIKKIWEEINS